MSADPFHLNRPVHLARRDGFYEKAAQIIHRLPSFRDREEQQQAAEQALDFLREARRHAAAANLAFKTSHQSRMFAGFLDMLIDNTLSMVRMLQRQGLAEAPDSPSLQFLQSRETAARMSTRYRRCAAHILKGLIGILKAAEKPCHDLQQTSLAKMSLADKARYDKARACFEQESGGGPDRPETAGD